MHQDSELFLNRLEAKSKDVPMTNVVGKWFLYDHGFGIIQSAVIKVWR
jgi:hypothetical protein